MHIKINHFFSFLISFALTSIVLPSARHNSMPISQALPALSSHLLNATPVNTGIVPPHMRGDTHNQLITASFPDSLVKSYAAPLAVSTIASYMKNPYLLLVVSEGIAVAYFLSAQQDIPSSAAQAYFNSFNNSLALSAVTGSVSALARTTSTSLVSSAQSAYVKPLVLGGALLGAATAYFSPALSDDQKSVAYAGLVATAMPVVERMCASVVQSLTLPEQKGVAKKVQEGKYIADHTTGGGQTKERVTKLAVALIALGGVVTTVQAYQEGTLSPETQLLAGLTLSSAVHIARESVVYEYGYRAAQHGIAAGSRIVTNIIAEPVKQYGQWLIDGVFNAFGWQA
jgi:hypothetical protein